MNWGIKIIIGLALFMTFIIAMATKMFINSGDDDLVEKDYYEKGLSYDRQYDLQKIAHADSVIPHFNVEQSGLAITFTSSASYKLLCRRASDSALDRLIKGTTGNDKLLFISRNELRSGPWKLHLEFSQGGKNYLVEREVMIP